MLCPNTAKPGRSIWDIINRRPFELHIDALRKTGGFVPEPYVLEKKDWPTPRRYDALPFDVELQLSDDFAFISACEYGVGYVTVATIEPPKNSDGSYTLRLAANEGISEPVNEALVELLHILEKCATKSKATIIMFELSREECAEQSFNVIINLNRNRILGRLESTHFQRPAYNRGRRDPLTVRLKRLLPPIAVRDPVRRRSRATLSRELDALHNSFLSLESLAQGEATPAIKAIVKEAYFITVDGISLPRRLQEIGLSSADSRDIREVNKVANYWRICLSFADIARSYRGFFIGLGLAKVIPYKPVQESNEKRFVHAEVQMIVYYETSSTAAWPLALGSSKEACYLCHSFIKAHASFYVSKAHRQIFHQWTVPDLSTYDLGTLKRFREALAAVDQLVMRDLERAQNCKGSRPFPLQSSINLHKLELPALSLTSATSSVGARSGAASTVSRRPHETNGRLGEAQVHDSSATETHCTDGLPIHERALTPRNEVALPPVRHSSLNTVVLTPVSSEQFCLDWLNLHIYLDNTSLKDRNKTQTLDTSASYPPQATIEFNRLHNHDTTDQDTKFSIEDIVHGEEIIIPSPNTITRSSNSVIEFILETRTRGAVRVSCSWN